MNGLTNNQKQLINKVSQSDGFLYELTEYITDKNRPYSETLMERDGTGQLSTIYTYGNQRINSESYNNLTGLYTYDGRGSVSAVIGGYGDFRASYWYDGLGNVKSQIHGYGAFGSGKKYYGYNAEQYNPVTGNQNLRNRQLNIRRQRFLTEDTYLGVFTETLSINRYIYGNDNPLKYKDPSGYISFNEVIQGVGRTITNGILSINNTITTYNDFISGVANSNDISGNISQTLTNYFRSFPITDDNNNGNYQRGSYTENLPDYTSAINELLIREENNYRITYNQANNFQQQAKNTGYLVGKFISSVTFNGFGVNSIYPNIIENTTGAIGNVIGSFGSRAIRYYDFYQKEKTFGPLDIKQPQNWNNLFDTNLVPYPSEDNPYFKYNGIAITAGELGNIAYGYWGKSLGFTDDELFYGGGVARMLVDRNFDNIWNSLITDKYYGDKPKDIEDIMKGIALYNKLHLNMGCGGAR